MAELVRVEGDGGVEESEARLPRLLATGIRDFAMLELSEFMVEIGSCTATAAIWVAKGLVTSGFTVVQEASLLDRRWLRPPPSDKFLFTDSSEWV